MRIRKDYQNISVYGAKKVKHSIDSDRIHRAVQDRRSLNSMKRREARELSTIKYMDMYAELLKNSSASKLISRGLTGKSVRRADKLDNAQFGREVAKMGRAVRKNDMALKMDDELALQQGKGQLDQSYASVMFAPQPGIPAPRPVLGNVMWGAVKDGISIAGSIAGLGTGLSGSDTFWKDLFS